MPTPSEASPQTHKACRSSVIGAACFKEPERRSKSDQNLNLTHLQTCRPVKDSSRPGHGGSPGSQALRILAFSHRWQQFGRRDTVRSVDAYFARGTWPTIVPPKLRARSGPFEPDGDAEILAIDRVFTQVVMPGAAGARGRPKCSPSLA